MHGVPLPARGKPPSVVREVVLLDTASSELTELGVYIASESSAAVAEAYLERIYATCMSLAAFSRTRHQAR